VRRDAFGHRRASFVTGDNTDVAARELWMHDLFVVPAWRSHGVGRARIASLRGRALVAVAGRR